MPRIKQKKPLRLCEKWKNSRQDAKTPRINKENFAPLRLREKKIKKLVRFGK
jgi:hypothetical protein